MANAIVTFKIMPESPENNVEDFVDTMLEIARKHGAKGEMQTKVEPLAFGLKQLLVYAMFSMDDDKDFDSISAEMAKVEGVGTTEIVNMDLAMG